MNRPAKDIALRCRDCFAEPGYDDIVLCAAHQATAETLALLRAITLDPETNLCVVDYEAVRALLVRVDGRTT